MTKDGWPENERDWRKRTGDLIHFQPADVVLQWQRVCPDADLFKSLGWKGLGEYFIAWRY